MKVVHTVVHTPFLLLFLLSGMLHRYENQAIARDSSSGAAPPGDSGRLSVVDNPGEPGVNSPAAPDSMRGGASTPYVLGEVVVTATYEPLPSLLGPTPVSVLTDTDLRSLPASGLSPLLRILANTSVRSYGGPHAVQTASLRGLSPENTLLLVDGVRWNSPQNALADLGLLGLTDLGRIEVARGGQSAFYGADAVGGTIHLISTPPSRETEVRLQGRMGSPRSSALSMRLSGTTAGVGWSGSAGSETGRGDYRYAYDDGLQDTILRREGADYRISTGTLQLRFGDSLSGGGSLLAVVTDADRGSPAAVTSTTPAAGARLADRQASGVVSLQRRAGDAAELRLRSSYLWNRQEYTDPGLRLDGNPLHSVHRTTSLLIAPEVLVEPDASFRLTAGAELGRNGITSTDVPDESRMQASLYAGTAHRFSFAHSVVNDLSLYPSVRIDTYSGTAPGFQPHLGVNVGLSEDPVLRVRAAVSGNSRIPTFNELYWQPGGNPDLRPERSLSAETGVVFGVEALGIWDARVTLYSVSTTDRIVWLPGDRGIWSPRNLRSVRTEGIETELSWGAAGGWIRFSASGAWLAARRTSEDFPGDPTAGNEIPFTPGQLVSGTGILTAGPFTFSATYSWVGGRYADEANTRPLPPYGTADAALRCDAVLLAASWFLQAEVFNILDTPYEVLPLYPMPMREFHATIGVRL